MAQKRVRRKGRAPSGGQGRKDYDPLLNSKHWRVTVRGYWVGKREPCKRCGGAIDYDSPRFYPGTSKVNPLTLAVGHIVGRHEARLAGWTDAQINDISNTQPEHARCSDSSGATYGNQYRGKVRRLQRGGLTIMVNEPSTQPELDGSREW